MGFNLADYEPVADRLARFWAEHPDGRIITILSEKNDSECTFSCNIWIGDQVVVTGWANELRTERGVNSTSWMENCETSAIGRALANLGYQTKLRPSREEMEKVVRATPVRQPAPRERLDRCKALIVSEADKAWAKKVFRWPWTDSDCDAIEARVGIENKEEPF
jgi:hypothetical protein